jgi:hypothetical protein
MAKEQIDSYTKTAICGRASHELFGNVSRFSLRAAFRLAQGGTESSVSQGVRREVVITPLVLSRVAS